MGKINGWAFGLDISVAVEAIVYWYTGDINNFGIESFNGTRAELNIGGSLLIDAAVGWTVSAPDKYGGRIIGIKQAWGVGWSPFMLSGNLNRGQTTVY
jgi:hypothetical protein